MAENSKIEWTDHTFNPWEGCQKVGPGCDHCYAEARNARFGGGQAVNWGPGAPRRRTSAANWRKPLAWNSDAGAFYAQHGRRQRVFCSSLADVFDNAVDPTWRRDLFDLMELTPNLDWLLLTKRIGNVARMLPTHDWAARDNVWLGATIVNQAEADRDIPKLLAVPARRRFLSMEPLLGPVDLGRACRLAAFHATEVLDWVIVGGESGPKARPMNPQWATGLRDQCQAAGIPFLFKQWGEWARAGVRQSGLPGRYALATREGWFGEGAPAPTELDQFPRQFLAFGSDVLERVGKKAAGRVLDGREWNEVPR
ncbi:phage Gp37/Gp68 family protein [Achromobacter insolitus]|uniref:phage Gp37/Gp68 family protein n=1 Tax=Achromobacter insolitus TaxID=217204 RepID=UPI0028B01B0C|nr:phage Gp37/Gp68 family protein [Achromobacter insolitus]